MHEIVNPFWQPTNQPPHHSFSCSILDNQLFFYWCFMSLKFNCSHFAAQFYHSTLTKSLVLSQCKITSSYEEPNFKLRKIKNSQNQQYNRNLKLALISLVRKTYFFSSQKIKFLGISLKNFQRCLQCMFVCMYFDILSMFTFMN